MRILTRRFAFTPTPLAGLWVVERGRIEDDRGFFSRFFCQQEFAGIGLSRPISQINHTLTRNRGTVRGMHFQTPPHAEAKLVSCVEGTVFDVAVDIRTGSSTFLAWHGEVVSAGNRKSLFIPEGFAHGFQALSDDCQLIYLHTAPYAPEAEGGLNPSDPALAIDWPLPISEVSERDRGQPLLGPDFAGVTLT